MKAVSVETMQALDREAMDIGIAQETLMGLAGRGFFNELQRYVRTALSARHCCRYAVLAGKGNNGGDAYVAALLLSQSGEDVTVYALCGPEQLKGAARTYAYLAQRQIPLQICEEPPAEAFTPGTVIVDGLLGTGAKGSLRAPYDQWVQAINASACPVAA